MPRRGQGIAYWTVRLVLLHVIYVLRQSKAELQLLRGVGIALQGTPAAPQTKDFRMGFTGTYGQDNTPLAPGDVVSISKLSCESAPYSEVTPTVAILDANNLGDFDLSRTTPSDSNRICICAKGVYTGSVSCDSPIFAGYMTIQDEMTHLVINGIPGNRLNFPQGWCEGGAATCAGPAIFLAYARAVGTLGYLSVIGIDQSCKTPAGNPTAATATASGRLSLDMQKQITSSEPLRHMKTGWYKVCLKPDLSNLFNWKETGIVVGLRADISGLEVNGLVSVAAFVPQTMGVRMRVCQQANCAVPAPAGSVISLIAEAQECGDPASNPASPRAGVSGHVAIGPQGLLDQSKIDDLLNMNSRLGLDRRQVCFKANGASYFVPTGLTLTVQDAVLGLQINGVRNKRGLMPVIPRARDVDMIYFRRDGKEMIPGESFALLPPGGLCKLLCQTQATPLCDAAVPSHYAPSGFLSAHKGDGSIGTTSCLIKASPAYQTASRGAGDINCDPAVSSKPDFSAMAPGSYQLCYRGASTCAYFSCWPTWEATGIHVRVQEQVVALELHPGRGNESGYGLVMRGLQITTVPNDWNSIGFVNGINLDMQVAFMLMPFDSDCSDLDPEGAERGEQIGPLASAGRVANPVQFAAALRARGIGIHNMCMRIGDGQYMSSGLSVRVQGEVASILVNGVQPNRGVLVPVPAVRTSRIKFAGSRTLKIGDMMSFIGAERSCANPLENSKTILISADGRDSVSGFIGFEARMLVMGKSEIILQLSSMMIILESMPVDVVYKVCFRPQEAVIHAKETGFLETGLAFVLQSELVSLQINKIGSYIVASSLGSNRGVRTALSNTNGNFIQLSRPGMLSLIVHDGDCTSTFSGGDNQLFSERLQLQHLLTTGPSNIISGPGLDGVVGVGGAKTPGLYQVCFKNNSADAMFAGTGLAVLIQADFVSLIVNDADPNRGLRTSLPLNDANRIRYTSRRKAAQGHPDDMLSLISIGGDCMDPKDNPMNSTRANDVIPGGFAEADSSGHIRSGAGDMSFLNMKRVVHMRAGVFSVCFRPGFQSAFLATGIVAEIQDVINALIVNSVSSVSASVPKVPGNQIGYCVDSECRKDGLAADRLSFISADLSCEDILENPVVGRVDKSGHLSPVGSTRLLTVAATDVLLNEEAGLLGVRVFQVCFSRNGGPFFTTGVTMRVHVEILGLIINGVMPNNGLRTSLPKGPGARIVYYRTTQGIAGEAISLIWDQTENRKCEVIADSDNPVVGNSRASGHWAVNGPDRSVQGADWAAQLETGIFQVCFRSADGAWKSTGLSVKLQSAVIAIEINEDGKTQQATLLKETGNAITFTGDHQLDGALKGTLIMSRGQCADTEKWNTAVASKSASGWRGGLFIMSPGYNSVVPMRDHLLSSPKTLLPLKYQFCVYVGPPAPGENDVGWIETGIAVTISWTCETEALATSFDLVYAHETTSFASHTTVVSILLKSSLPSLPRGGVLVITGLQGSLTADNDSMEVQGSAVRAEQHLLPCLGAHRCSVRFKDYLANGRMLISASVSVRIHCSDLDSTNERITSLNLNGQSILASAATGPWNKCANDCSAMRQVVQGLPVSAQTGPSGAAIDVEMTLSDQVQVYMCNNFTLSAEVMLDLVTSQLSTHSLSGTWDQLAGQLNLADTPYMEGPWMHLSFVLRNPAASSPPRIPIVSMCALSGVAPSIPGTEAQIIHGSSGLLTAKTQPALISFHVSESSITEQAVNTLSFVLRSNLPKLLPENLVVMISGLTSSLTPASSSFPLLTESSRRKSTSECVGGLACSKKVSLACADCGPLHTASLSVQIFCTDFDAVDGSKFIQYIRLCQVPKTGEDKCAGDQFIDIPAEMYSRGPWQGCGGCSRSFQTVLLNYDLGSLVNAWGDNFIVEIGASPGVSSLYCYDSYPEHRSIRATLDITRIYAMQTAVFTGFKGELIFNPNMAIMKCGYSDPSQNAPCLPELRFDIELKNPKPSGTNAGTMLQAKAVGSGLDLAPISFGPVMGTVPIGAITVKEATLQEVTQIRGDAPKSRGLNRLRLQVRFSEPIPAGTIITLSGLTGSLTPSSSCKPVPAPTCTNAAHCIFSSADATCQRGLPLVDHRLASALSGSWDQAKGALIFAVQPAFNFKQDLHLSFLLLNPGPRQAAPAVFVSASGPRGAVVPHQVSSSVLRGGEAYIEPVSQTPRITSASSQESNKIETQPNIITIRITSNIQLEQGTIVTLTGLQNMEMRPDADGNAQYFVWYGDNLEHAQSVLITGNAVVPVAQWQGVIPAQQPGAWFCSAKDRGWIESGQPATVKQQGWCQMQSEHSMLLRLARCFETGAEISFTMTLPNGMVPTAEANGVPLIALSGLSVVTDSAPVLPVSLNKEYAVKCQGLQACTVSVEQDENCYDAECRYLSASAVMTQALLSVDIACTDFGQIGKFVERIGVCLAPTCAPPFTWSREENNCCNDMGLCLDDFLCSESLPAGAFDRGPWDACTRDCQASRRALHKLDIMPIICAEQTPCVAPKTFVVVISASTFVEDDSCGTSPLDATVQLDYTYTYKKALQAAEKGRITSFKVQEDTSTARSLSTIAASFVVSSRMVAGTNVSLSFLQGSSMPDDARMQIENVECSQLDIEYLICNPSLPSEHFFASTGVWDQEKGTLVLLTVASVPPTRRVSFRFVLQNAAAKQKPSYPRLVLDDGTYVMGPRTSWFPLLLSNTAPKVNAGGLTLESSDVQAALNTITVAFSCNFALSRNSAIEIAGLTGSGTADTKTMQVDTDVEILNAVWTQETGTLRITTAQIVISNFVLQFAFTLVNPIFSQEPRVVQVNVDEPALPGATAARLSSPLENRVLGGGTRPGLEFAVLHQSDTMAGQWNSIRASFGANSPLPFGSRIAITGLQGAQNPDELFLPVTIESSACKPNRTVHAFAEWYAEPGTLRFILQCHLPVGTKVCVNFMLLNPNTTAPEKSAFIAASGSNVHFSWTPMVNSVLGPTQMPAFSIAAVTESTQQPVSEADILIVLQANIDIPKGSVLEISRLIGSSSSVLSSDGAVVLDSSAELNGAELGSEWESKWDVARGELELVAGSVVAQGKYIRLLIHLQNPILDKNGVIPVVRVKSQPGESQRVLIPSHLMSGSALSARVTGRVLTATLYERAFVQGSENPIKLEFILDFNVGPGAQILLTGLLGSLTPDGFLKLGGQDGPLFGNNATWRQEPGQLILSVPKKTFCWKAAGQKMSVEFTVRNPPGRQPTGIQPSIQSPWLISEPFSFPTDIFRAQSASSWIKHTISESCAARGCLNTITITVAVDASLPPGTQITISSITGARNNLGPIPVFGPDSGYIKNKEAMWSQEVLSGWDVIGVVFKEATLVMTLQDTFQPYTDFSISFQVINLDVISGNAQIYVSASGNQTSEDSFTLDKKQLTGAVLVGSQSAKFLSSIISESSQFPAVSNTITISLSASITMFQGTAITISDLKGSASADDNALLIRSVDNVMRTSGAWRQKDGFLVVELAADVAAYQPFAFSFEIRNPAQTQEEVSPQIWTNEFKRATLARDSLKWHMGFQRWRGWLDPTESPGVARSVLGASDGLQWTLLQITEQSNVLSVRNQLQLSLMTSGIIPAGVIITVSELTGSASEDSATMPVSLRLREGPEAFVNARFIRILGTLTFEIPAEVPAGTLYFISFSLMNPAAPQIPVRPKVSMKLIQATIDMAATQASAVVPCCLGAGGTYYVESATIRESTDVVNQQNVLYLTVSTSFPLLLGTVFSVTGLAGSQTPSNVAMILNGIPSLTAKWTQAGSLEFQVSSELYDCPTCDDTPEAPCQSRRKISISFQLQNAQAEQEAPRIQIVAQDAGAKRLFEPTHVAGGQNVLRARGASRIIAQISESSRTAGAVNLITVTIRANTALDACHTSLFIPGLDVQKAWVSDSRSLSDCPWRGGLPCFDPSNLFDGLKVKGVQIAMYDPGKPGSGYVGFDLGASHRIDAFQVMGTKDTSTINIKTAQAKSVRLMWAELPSPDPAAWRVAKAIELPFDSGTVESGKFPAVSARYWRLEALSNHEAPSFNLYKYSNVQELQFFACLDADSTRIFFKNLTGTLTPDDPKMTLVNLATESPGSLKATGIWTQSTGQLEVKLDYLAKAYDEMTFGINLQYPPISAPQAPRTVIISVSGNVGYPLRIADTPVFGNVLGIGSTTQTSAAVQPAASQTAPQLGSQASASPVSAQDVRAFAIAIIRGSSKLARADNTISVTLEPQVDLPAGTKITIIGLVGTRPALTAKEFRSFKSVQPSAVLVATYSWENSACASSGVTCGRLVATTLAKMWTRGQKLVASFSVENNEAIYTRQTPVRIKATWLTHSGEQDMCQTMTIGGICKMFPDVLNVQHLPGLLSAVALDTTSTQSQENLIRVMILPNVEVLSGTRFTVAGLLGSSTWSTDALKLHGSSSFLFGFQAAFNQQAGTLVVTAARDLGNSETSPAFEISFSLTNAATPQPAQTVSVTMQFPSGVVGTCAREICDVLPQIGTQPGTLYSLGTYTDETTAELLGQVQLASGNVVPVVQTNPSRSVLINTTTFLRAGDATGFITKIISESTNVADHDTVIRVTLSPNFLVRDGSIVTIKGLTGTQSADSSDLRVAISGEGDREGTWAKATGTLKISLQQTLLAHSGTVILSFVLRNAASAQTALPAPTVGMVGVLPQPLQGVVLGAAGKAILTGVGVRESGQVVKEENVLTFRMTSNVPLMQGVSVTISHLVGRNEACEDYVTVLTPQTITLPPVQIAFEGAPQPLQSELNEASLIGNGTASLCLNVDGRVTMQLPFSVLAGVEVVFAIKVYNWKARLNGTEPQVAIAGCIAPLTVAGSSAAVGKGTSDITVGVALVCDGTKRMQLTARAADEKVLASGLEPEILDLEVTESTPVIAQSNTIYVKLQLSFRLVVGAELLLQGLSTDQQTSQTPDNSALELNGNDVRFVGGNAVWNQAAGTLKLTAVETLGPNRDFSFSFPLLNAEEQSKARCALGEPFCSPGALWEGQPCPVVGATCAGECRGGINFCGDPVIGVCSKFSLPSQQDQANAACPGGVCLVPNNGRQCPPGTLLSSKGLAGPAAHDNYTHGYTLSEQQYKGTFVFVDGVKTEVRGSTCDPKGGGTCFGQGQCIAPNTGEICDNHLMCTGVFYPAKRIASDQFAHRGPALCRRLRLPADITLKVTQPGLPGNSVQRKARGEVFGVVNPEPPEFKTRVLTESTDVASATNTLSVLLKTNFMMQKRDLQATSVTLSGLSSETASAVRMPVLSAQQHLAVFVDCLNSMETDGQHVVTCLAVGERTLQREDLIIEARLSLDAKCAWPHLAPGDYCSSPSSPSLSCLLVSGIRVGGAQEQGFSAAPCLERSDCSSDGMCRVMDLLPVAHLLDPTRAGSGSGFVVELNVSHALQVRAKIDLYFTSEFVEWNKATGTVNLTGISAPSLMIDETTLAFSFQLPNAAVKRKAQVVTIIGESGAVKNIGICDDVVEPGCRRPGDASTARTILSGSVLSAKTSATFLATALVTEESDIQSARNTITITLAPEHGTAAFTAGSRVTVSGLGSGLYPSTNSLAVASGRVSLHAKWSTYAGQLVAEVTSQPARSNAPLIFSFTIRNPGRTQAPLRPSALVVGGWRNAKAWGAEALVCKTQPGCVGVLGGGSALGFTTTQIWETGRQLGEENPISLSLRANVPILTKPSVIYIHGLNMPQQVSGPVEIMGGESLIRRGGSCRGQGRCVMTVDSRPPRGTAGGKLSLDLRVDCRYITSLSEVSVCGHQLPISAFLPGYCSSWSANSVKMTSVIQDFVVIVPCQKHKALVEVSADGLLTAEAVLSIYYAYDQSTMTAEWRQLPGSSSDRVLKVKLVPNSSHPMSPSATDAYSFAFKFRARNSPTKITVSKPSIKLEYDGTLMAEAQAVDSELGVLGSGMVNMPAVSFWDAGQVIPSRTSSIFPTGLDCLVVVNAPPGMITKIFFSDIDLEINTDRLYLIDGDSLLSSRMGGIYDESKWGDVTLRLGGGFFDSRTSHFISGSPSFGVFLVRTPPPPSFDGGVVPLEASTGRAGVRVTSIVADRNKVDHVIAVISIDGLPPLPSTGAAKVARQLALLINIIASRVMVEGPSRRALPDAQAAVNARASSTVDDARLSISADYGRPNNYARPSISERERRSASRWSDDRASERRVSHDSLVSPIAPSQSRRRGVHRERGRGGEGGRGGGEEGDVGLRASQDVTLRILAASPADAIKLTNSITSVLTSGVLTAALQAAGMPGVSKLKSIKYFRCGTELQCEDVAGEITNPQTKFYDSTPRPGVPLPMEFIIGISAAVGAAIGVAVGMACMTTIVVWVRRTRERQRLAQESKYLYLCWLYEAKQNVIDGKPSGGTNTLHDLEGNATVKLSVSEACELYNLEYLDFNYDAFIEDLCVKLFYIEEYPAKLADQVDKSIGKDTKELEFKKTELKGLLKKQEALADEGGMKAEKARETLEMTIFDCKEDIKDKEKALEIKTKTQLQRRKKLRANENRFHWHQLPEGFPQKMALDPAAARKTMEELDTRALEKINKQLDDHARANEQGGETERWHLRLSELPRLIPCRLIMPKLPLPDTCLRCSWLSKRAPSDPELAGKQEDVKEVAV